MVYHALAVLFRSAPEAKMSVQQRTLYLNLVATVRNVYSAKKQQFKPLWNQLETDITRDSLLEWLKDAVGKTKFNEWGDIDAAVKSPKTWGRIVWKFIHATSLLYKDSKHDSFAEFLRLVGKTLPCKTCKSHFLKLLGKPDIKKKQQSISSVRGWVNYNIYLHNKVTKQTAKEGAKYLLYRPLPASTTSQNAILKKMQAMNYYQYSSPYIQTRRNSQPINLNVSMNSVTKTKYKAKCGGQSCGCGG